MSDHNGLRYLFDQSNINATQATWLATLSEFDFEIRYIKGNENQVRDALIKKAQVNHIATVSSYGIELQDRILQVGQQDDKYMVIMHMLQQSTSTGVGIGAGTGTGDQDADYRLTVDGLVMFRDRIYVPNFNELKNLILRELHLKSYSSHQGYQNTLTTVNKFYYWLNLKKEVVEFMARCSDCQQVKVE